MGPLPLCSVVISHLPSSSLLFSRNSARISFQQGRVFEGPYLQRANNEGNSEKIPPCADKNVCDTTAQFRRKIFRNLEKSYYPILPQNKFLPFSLYGIHRISHEKAETNNAPISFNDERTLFVLQYLGQCGYIYFTPSVFINVSSQ